MPHATVITPKGPFSWSASMDMLKTWQPVRQFARPDRTALLAFGLDGSFEPAGAIVREDGGTLKRSAASDRSGREGSTLRAAGVTEPFPIDEPRTLRALADAYGLADVPARDELRAIAERFKPFGMWVSVLLRVAANRGSMGEPRG